MENLTFVCKRNKNIVDDLLRIPFLQLSQEEKQRLVATGRPMPDIRNLPLNCIGSVDSKSVGLVCRFSANDYDIYDEHKWLTASAALNGLFCWPCLLFEPGFTLWSRDGFKDVDRFSNEAMRHSQTHNHIHSFLKLSLFEKDLQLQSIEQKKLDIKEHNRKVTWNRAILCKLINTVCHLVKIEPLYGVDVKRDFSSLANCQRYQKCLELLSEFDDQLKTHLQTSALNEETSEPKEDGAHNFVLTVDALCRIKKEDEEAAPPVSSTSCATFNGASISFENNLINSIASVVLNQIKKEVMEAKYASIILDETSEVINESQLSTVLRYVDNDGIVQERFIRFTDVSADKTATAVYEHVVQIVEEFKIQAKLVAQSYDGSSVMAGHMSDLCRLVKDKYPTALCVHCIAHNLNSVLQKVCANILECRLFFSMLSGFLPFLFRVKNRMPALLSFMLGKFPKKRQPHSHFVNLIVEFLPQLLALLEELLEHAEDWDEEIIVRAQGYIYFLSKFSNVFLLVVFDKLFACTNLLHNGLQASHFDIEQCLKIFKAVEATLMLQRQNFDSIWEFAHSKWLAAGSCDETHSKKKKITCEVPKESEKLLFIEIVELVLSHISDRYSTLKNFKFIQLLNPDFFSLYHNNRFSTEVFEDITEAYPTLFNVSQLKNELAVLHGPDLDALGDKSPKRLVPGMLSLNLDQMLPELYKFACLYLTLPSTPAEQPFTALPRILGLPPVASGQKRQLNLAFLAVEHVLLSEVKAQPAFYSSVFDEFVKVNREVELTHVEIE